MPKQNNNTVSGLVSEARQETMNVGSTLKKAAKLALDKVKPAAKAVGQKTAEEMRYAADWLSGENTRPAKRAKTAAKAKRKPVGKTVRKRVAKVLKAGSRALNKASKSVKRRSARKTDKR